MIINFEHIVLDGAVLPCKRTVQLIPETINVLGTKTIDLFDWDGYAIQKTLLLVESNGMIYGSDSMGIDTILNLLNNCCIKVFPLCLNGCGVLLNGCKVSL